MIILKVYLLYVSIKFQNAVVKEQNYYLFHTSSYY